MKLSHKYHKIQSVYKRDPKTKKFMIGDYTNDEIKFLKDLDWVWTEKIDGTNIRVLWNGEDVRYAGRSDEATIQLPLVYKLDELFKSYGKHEIFNETFERDENEEIDITFYGEGCGKQIQKGGEGYCKDGVDFILFDVQVNHGERGIYLKREGVEDIAKKFGLKVVPIIGHGTLKEAIDLTIKGFKSQWGDFIAEGIVARPRFELRTRMGERIITKVKHRDFI